MLLKCKSVLELQTNWYSQHLPLVQFKRIDFRAKLEPWPFDIILNKSELFAILNFNGGLVPKSSTMVLLGGI